MRENQPTRRAMLGLLVAAPWASTLLTACGKKTEPDSCQDIAALSDADKTTRTALQYTDRSPTVDKQCLKCNFWQAPPDPAQCGGCQLVKGPIHPKGTCTAFAPKT
jgi:hypothetical protein